MHENSCVGYAINTGHTINKSANLRKKAQEEKLLLSSPRPAHTALDTYRIPTKFMPGASCPIGYPGKHSLSLLSLYANAAIKTKIQAAAIRVVYHDFLQRQSAHKKGKSLCQWSHFRVAPTDPSRCVDLQTHSATHLLFTS
jgi:hypothetical protein